MPKAWYLREKNIQHNLGLASFTMPSSVWLGLWEAFPDIEGGGEQEISGGSYARQELSLEIFDESSITNNALISFDDLPACTIVYWAIMDASTDGNILYYNSFEIPIIRTAGQDLEIEIGNLIVSED